VIRRAAEHHAGDEGQLALDRIPGDEPPVQHEHERREIAGEPAYHVVAQRWHLAVLLRRQPLQHRVACVHDEHVASGLRHRPDEIAHERVILDGVEADAVLDRHRQRHRVTHRAHAVGDERGLGHQARAEAAGLHALGRAAAVQVDLVVAPALAEPRPVRKLRGIAAPQLKRERMLGRVEIEMARHVAMRERRRRDHLGVEARMPRDQPQEVAAVPVGPVHHRRDTEAPLRVFHLNDLLLRQSVRRITPGAIGRRHLALCSRNSDPVEAQRRSSQAHRVGRSDARCRRRTTRRIRSNRPECSP